MRKLVPAETLEQSAAQRYQQMLDGPRQLFPQRLPNTTSYSATARHLRGGSSRSTAMPGTTALASGAGR